MIDLFIKGGWVMWPILLASIVALAVVLDRTAVYFGAREDIGRLLPAVLRLIDDGRIDEARALATSTRGPSAAVLAAGLSAWGLPQEEVDRRMERAAADGLDELETRIPVLATMVAVLPMLGFLGTVWGLILAFMAWAELGDNVNVTVLADGMYQAMITTAAGLITSIPYVVCYNIMAARTAQHLRDMNAAGSELSGRHRLRAVIPLRALRDGAGP